MKFILNLQFESFINTLYLKNNTLNVQNLKQSIVDHILSCCAEFLVSFDDFIDGFNEVFFSDSFSSCSDCEHTCFSANWSEFSTGCVGTKSCQKFVSDSSLDWHMLSMNLKYMDSSFKIWKTELNFSINSTWSH